MARSRVRVLFTSYSFRRLLWLVPLGFVVGFVEAIGDLLTGHPRRARAAFGSWFSNVVHVRNLRASRRRAQRMRTVHDSDLRELQVSTTARLSAFLAHHLHTDTRLRDLGEASRSAVDSMSDGVRTPAAIAFLGFLVLVVVGSRDLITGGVPSIGTFAHWPGVGDVFDAFGSAWRYTGLGSASPQPAALAVIGALGTVLLGSTALAQTLVVVVAAPMGAFGTYRLTRRAITYRGPALAAGLAYGINPVARNAISEGRLGPLVLFAVLPFVLLRAVRLGERSDARRGRVLRLALAARAARGVLSGRTRPRGRRGRGVRRRGPDRRERAGDGAGARRRRRRLVARAGAPAAVAARLRAHGRRQGRARVRVPAPPRPLAGPALRHRTGRRRLADVGAHRGGRGAAARRHRRPAGVDRTGLDARARRLGDRLGARALVPPHLGARAGGRARAGGARSRAVRRRRGLRARRRHPHLPLRVASAARHHRRGGGLPPCAHVRGRRGRRRVGHARQRVGERARLHRVADRQGRLPHALGRRSGGAAARPGRPARRHGLRAHPQRARRRGRAVARPGARHRPRARPRARAGGERPHRPPGPDAGSDGRALRGGAEHAGARRWGARGAHDRGAQRDGATARSRSAAFGRGSGALREPRGRTARRAGATAAPARRSHAAEPRGRGHRPDARGAAHLERRVAGHGALGEAYDSQWKASAQRPRPQPATRLLVGQRVHARHQGRGLVLVRRAVGPLGDARGCAGHLAARGLALAPRRACARSVPARTTTNRTRRERRTRPGPLSEFDDEAFWWERV